MLPLPGSPVIDAGSASSGEPGNDQRGFARSGPSDLGAVEYQGTSDLRRVFDLDADGDGHALGFEQALGTDPFTADRENPRNLMAPTFDPEGNPVLRFGIAGDAAPGTIWIVERTTDLQAFGEIYRFDGSEHHHDEGAVGVELSDTGVAVTDRTPPPGSAYYRLRIVLTGG